MTLGAHPVDVNMDPIQKCLKDDEELIGDPSKCKQLIGN
jgi:hypothetical protein